MGGLKRPGTMSFELIVVAPFEGRPPMANPLSFLAVRGKGVGGIE
jgi:hypothetical protein